MEIKPYLNKLVLPNPSSHKGQNGKLLIIGGSSLFHAASIWAAAMASRIVDMVHYSSTVENEQIFVNLKTKFVDGIVIKRDQLLDYAREDDCILIGPGMIRGEITQDSINQKHDFNSILTIQNEAEYTYHLVKYLIEKFPDKKYVFDAGALQMMDKNWLKKLKTPPILTPHAIEYARLFGSEVNSKNITETARQLEKTASEYNSVIMLKIIDDFISDGKSTTRVTGGNAGLAKGGTGDTLAGLCAALYTKNDPYLSCVLSSYLVKTTADRLYRTSHTWYNTSELITSIGKTFKSSLTL